jgi:hypothetical protein
MQWEKPKFGTLKFNVDAALLENENSFTACVFSTIRGLWFKHTLCGLYFIGTPSSKEAEANSLLQTLIWL